MDTFSPAHVHVECVINQNSHSKFWQHIELKDQQVVCTDQTGLLVSQNMVLMYVVLMLKAVLYDDACGGGGWWWCRWW